MARRNRYLIVKQAIAQTMKIDEVPMGDVKPVTMDGKGNTLNPVFFAHIDGSAYFVGSHAEREEIAPVITKYLGCSMDTCKRVVVPMNGAAGDGWHVYHFIPYTAAEREVTYRAILAKQREAIMVAIDRLGDYAESVFDMFDKLYQSGDYESAIRWHAHGPIWHEYCRAEANALGQIMRDYDTRYMTWQQCRNYIASHIQQIKDEVGTTALFNGSNINHNITNLHRFNLLRKLLEETSPLRHIEREFLRLRPIINSLNACLLQQGKTPIDLGYDD